MINVYKTIVVSFLLLITLFCGSKKQSARNVDKSENTKKDASEYYYEKLSLEHLSSSTDSIHIRFWLTYTSLVDSGKIINLKYRNGQWDGEYIAYRFKSKSIDDISPDLITKEIFKGSPKLGWESFLLQMENLGIYTLNDENRKENMGLCSDDNILKVEIGKEMIYNEFIYPCWEAIENQTQVNKVVVVLKLIEREFGFKISPLLAEGHPGKTSK